MPRGKPLRFVRWEPGLRALFHGMPIFDPDTVTDNGTMKQGGLPSTGIPYVVVNGTVVVKDSKVLKGVFPGEPIYGSGKAS